MAHPKADGGDERLTLRQARVLEVLAGAGAPVTGEARLIAPPPTARQPTD